MSEISRRDFLDSFALAIAAGLTPAMQVAAQPSRYPPALTGLRGQHVGSFEAAHAIARTPVHDAVRRLEPEERYDLVVVGGGISGLAAAYFYRRARPQARSNARPLPDFVADLPIAEGSRRQLLALFDARDPLAGRSLEEKLKLLKRTSYRDYLIRICGCSEEVANCFQGRTHGFFGLG